MTNLPGGTVDITMVLQSRLQRPDKTGALSNALKMPETAQSEGAKNHAYDEAAARKAANKFESLLIHNMLKSMRKTTMTQDKSNQRAIYDDMLDEKLADTMIKAGGIGISDQIVEQIRKQQGQRTSAFEPGTDATRLRELAKHITPATAAHTLSRNQAHTSSASQTPHDTARLSMATNLWDSELPPELNQQQINFLQSLLPHAKRNARKLGTSPSAIIAIAALETGWGRSTIKDKQGNESHNLFGIKASPSDTRYASTLTTEYIGGSPQKLEAKFKTYDSSAASVDGFADFILANPRYSVALRHASNPEMFLQELQTAGYATDPRYAEKAISIMRQIARNPLPL